MLNTNPQAKISSMVNAPSPATPESVNKTTSQKHSIEQPQVGTPKPPAPKDEGFLAKKWRQSKEWAQDAALGAVMGKMGTLGDQADSAAPSKTMPHNGTRPKGAIGPHRTSEGGTTGTVPKHHEPHATQRVPQVPKSSPPTHKVPKIKIPKTNFTR